MIDFLNPIAFFNLTTFLPSQHLLSAIVIFSVTYLCMFRFSSVLLTLDNGWNRYRRHVVLKISRCYGKFILSTNRASLHVIEESLNLHQLYEETDVHPTLKVIFTFYMSCTLLLRILTWYFCKQNIKRKSLILNFKLRSWSNSR